MSDESQTPVTPSAPAPEAQASAPTTSEVVASSESTESTPEVQASGESAPKGKDAKAEVAADKVGAEKVAADKFELKVDGEVLTLSKDEMIKYAQLGKAGQKRMQEAIEFQKQTKQNLEKLYSALKENPESILEDENIGHKKYDLAKKWLAEEMEEKAKSPEQKALEAERKRAKDLEDRLSMIEREKEEALARAQKESEDRETTANLQKLEKEIVDSFTKHGLPNSSAMLDRIVGIYEFSKAHDIPATMDDCAKVIKDEIRADMQQMAMALSEEDLEQLLGDAIITKVKSSTLKKMKSVNKPSTTETAKVQKEEVKVKPKISIDDWIAPDWSKD